MLKRFDENGNWIEDMRSKWPQGINQIDTKEHEGMLVVWSFYEHEILNFEQKINRNYIYASVGGTSPYYTDSVSGVKLLV